MPNAITLHEIVEEFKESNSAPPKKDRKKGRKRWKLYENNLERYGKRIWKMK
jgi:hypothetical protein